MGTRSEERLGTAPLLKLVFSIAIPAVLAQLVNLLYNIVDRVYIGHIPEVGAAALTGLGLCSPIILIVAAFAAFAGNGGAPLAAMELGRGDREKAGKILSNAIVMLLAFSLVLTVLLLAVKEPLLFFFGASENTISYAVDYIGIYLCGTVFVLLSMGLNSFIACQGRAGIAMVSVIVGALANIILDPIFIFALDMGVKGAAIATVISQGLSAAWILLFLLGKNSVIRVNIRHLKPERKIMAHIASLGVSPFIMNSTESLIAMVFTSGLQSYGGDIHVGAYAVLSSVHMLMHVPASAFAFGSQPVASYNYGAGNYSRVKKNFLIICAVGLVYTLGFYGLILLAPEFLAGLFTEDAELIALSARMLPVFLAGMSIFPLQMAAQSTVLGIGRAKASLFMAVFRKIILLIPLALVLPRFFGVDGVYWSEPVSDAISALVSLGLIISVFRSLKTEK